MIQSKKVYLIVAIALCLSVALTALMIGLGDSESAKLARQSAYVTELFGEEVISLNIVAEQADWDAMMENAAAKEYIVADVEVNGVTYQNVGVRTKGNASLTQVAQTDSPTRYSLHIKFDEYITGQTCEGLDELILNNMIADSTYMKEYLSQDLMRYIGVEAPLTNYADISLNGEKFGFYVALESYGDSYAERVYEDDLNRYYNVKSMGVGGGGEEPTGEKPTQLPDMGGAAPTAPTDQAPAAPTEETATAPPDEAVNTPDDGAADPAAAAQMPQNSGMDRGMGGGGMGGGASGGSLEYTDDALSSYSAIFDNACGTVSTEDQAKVVEALRALSTGTDLETYFDVDQILRYFAAHTVVVSLDSYYSNMAQNYVIQERDRQITILPWDYHLSYGGFQSSSADAVVNAAIDTPVSGVTMESRPLLNMLLSNEGYLAKYHQYLQEIVDGYFNSGLFEETVRKLQEKIAPYVEQDVSAFFTYEQFQTGVSTLVSLNLLRAQSIAGQLSGSIPATTDGQSADPSARIDASAINLSDLGTSGGGGGDGKGGFAPGEGMADPSLLREAMTLLQEAGGTVTDAVKAQLLALGLTEEQITQLGSRSGGRGGGAPPGGDTADKTAMATAAVSTTTGAQSQGEYVKLLGVLVLLLVAVVFIINARRRSY